MSPPEPLTLDHVVPWGRTFDEYVRMFSLDANDLAERVLGVGDGPASFNAEARRLGHHVVSVDPLYAYPADAIRRRIDETADWVVRRTTDHPERFNWRDIRNPAELKQRRMGAMQSFLADFAEGARAGRYIAGSLPRLPFADGCFDLAVCSHLLFLYADPAGDAFHIAPVRELRRVARQVRVFPLLDGESNRSRHLDAVIEAVAAAGCVAAVERVAYEFLRGGNEMLVVH